MKDDNFLTALQNAWQEAEKKRAKRTRSGVRQKVSPLEEVPSGPEGERNQAKKD